VAGLDEFGKIGLQVAQLCQSSLRVAGAGNLLGQLPPGAECLDRSHPLDLEAVAQHLDQIEYRALRVVQLSA
jgi:hypothetical protein